MFVLPSFLKGGKQVKVDANIAYFTPKVSLQKGDESESTFAFTCILY